MRKRLIFAFVLALCAALLCVGAWAAGSAPVLINGKDITAEEIELEKGTAAYDEATNTLTLTDATISSTGSTVPIVANTGLTIKLVGENTLTGDSLGIMASGGDSTDNVLRLEGSGSLTITCTHTAQDNAAGIQTNNCDIVIDGCTLTVNSQHYGIYSGSASSLEIENDASVTVTAVEQAIYAPYDAVTISDSCVKAHSEKSYGIYAYGSLDVEGSTLDIGGYAGDLEIGSSTSPTDHPPAFAIFVNEGNISFTDSTVETVSKPGNLSMAGVSLGEYTGPAIRAVGGSISITGNCDVTGDGGISADNSITVTPAEGGLMEIKTTNNTQPEHYAESPYDTEATFTGTELGGYAYVCIRPHEHTAESAATCTEKAVCSDCGREYGAVDPDNHTGDITWTITPTTHSGTYNCCGAGIPAAAHKYEGGVCTACGYDKPPVVPDPNAITITQPANGTVSTNFSNASAGATITVTATPDSGYELAYITVNGEKIDGTTFTMPDEAVTVSAVFVPATGGFTDVVPGAWYMDAVNYVVANGLMEGTSATTFEPEAQMTRAMVWTILARMDGETISGSSWSSTAREWAMANGVSDGTDPNGLVTREQLVTMLWRYAGEPESAQGLSGYTDAGSVSGWAEAAMAWAIEKGVIAGITATTLAPQATATRAQAAAVLMRFDLLGLH